MRSKQFHQNPNRIIEIWFKERRLHSGSETLASSRWKWRTLSPRTGGREASEKKWKRNRSRIGLEDDAEREETDRARTLTDCQRRHILREDRSIEKTSPERKWSDRELVIRWRENTEWDRRRTESDDGLTDEMEQPRRRSETSRSRREKGEERRRRKRERNPLIFSRNPDRRRETKTRTVQWLTAT